MNLRPTLIAVTLLVSGCAHQDPALPVCDGLARRPANPHGSVLVPAADPSPVPAPATPPTSSGGCA